VVEVVHVGHGGPPRSRRGSLSLNESRLAAQNELSVAPCETGIASEVESSEKVARRDRLSGASSAASSPRSRTVT